MPTIESRPSSSHRETPETLETPETGETLEALEALEALETCVLLTPIHQRTRGQRYGGRLGVVNHNTAIWHREIFLC